MSQVLFVCLGNICRSPAAEAVMNKLIEKNDLSEKISCDSAGTSSYHVGGPADSRMRKVAQQRGFDITSISRQINYNDLDQFDYIIAMDQSNYYDIRAIDRKTDYLDKIFQLKDFCLQHQITGVPDPYYGGQEGFDLVIDILEDGCQELLNKIRSENNL